MKLYTGVKVVQAEAMSRIDAERHLGRSVDVSVVNQEWEAPGYLVRFSNGEECWRTKQQFEDNYRQCAGVPFSVALEALKRGKIVRRAHWSSGDVDMQIYTDGGLPYLSLDIDDYDILAEDWEILV